MALSVARSTPLEGAVSPQVQQAPARERVAAVLRSELLVVGALAVLGILSRVFTTNSLAGEPTSDEYFFAIFARDIARSLAEGQGLSLGAVAGEGRVLAVETALLSFLVPWDHLTLGRTIQALFNALCAPAAFLLARQVGLPRAAAVAGAIILLAAPEFQEFSWRFWSDSQATLLGLLYLTLLVRFARRPSVASAVAAVGVLVLLFLTKDSAAVVYAPFLLLAAARVLFQRVVWWPARMALAAAFVTPLVGMVALLVVGGPLADRLSQASFGRLFLYGPRILRAMTDALPRLPEYTVQAGAILGPFDVSTAFLWSLAVGGGWTAAQAVRVWLADKRPSVAALGWLAALAAWSPVLYVPLRRLSTEASPTFWVWVGVALLGVVAGFRATGPGERDARRAWGLTLLGSLALALFAQRLLIWATPTIAAAFTHRSLMPAVPLLAILGGAGLWGASTAVRLFPWRRSTLHAACTLVLALGAVALASPAFGARLSPLPLLGRPGDRGADPTTPQGLRVEALVRAEGWLRANLRPGDRVATGIPRHLAWYSGMTATRMEDEVVNLGSFGSSEAARRAGLRNDGGGNRVAPTDRAGVAYVVDFNVWWTRPDEEQAREWRQTFEWLASQPYMEVAYLERDVNGYPVLYVIRNHGFAASYSYRDREQARAEQLERVRRQR